MVVAIEQRQVGDNFVIFGPAAPSASRIGIYAYGGCHLHALFACAPLIQQVLKGTCCILHEGMMADTRSDLILQTLEDLPQEWLDPVIEKLHLEAGSFRSRLFTDSITVPGPDGPQEFPKAVIVLHIGADSNGRIVYRHRKHGFLVDPGGGWLKSVNSILGDLSSIAWFREQFEVVGPVSMDAFVANYTRIIRLLRERTDARIMVFNTLTVEPGGVTHNYQFLKNPHPIRWREFNIALLELSRQLDFPVVDLDWILKRSGIRTQTEFAHFLPGQNMFIAHEVFRVMRDLGVFEGSA